MSSIRVSGNTSGYYDLTVPDVAGTNTIPLNQVVTHDGNGNLGIGTTTPVTSLHVAKAGNGIVTIERTNKASGTGYFGINVENNSQTTLAFDNTSNFVIGRSGDPSTQAGFNNDFLINSSGNVGIGVTNPEAKLDVRFTGRSGINVGSNNGQGAYIGISGAADGDLAGSDYAYIEHNSSGVLNFNVGNSTNSVTTRMAIHPEGYVLNDNVRFATTISYVSGFRSTGVVSNWRTPHVNTGSAFNSSNGRFTAPVTGTYRFEFHTNVLRDGTGVYYLEWYKNGANIAGTVGGRIYDQWDGGWANACGFVMMDLNVNDYVELWHTGGSITLDGNSYGQYCGYLVG